MFYLKLNYKCQAKCQHWRIYFLTIHDSNIHFQHDVDLNGKFNWEFTVKYTSRDISMKSQVGT